MWEPIVEHNIRRYLKFGYKDFILATGYKKEQIEKYFKKLRINANIKCIFTGLRTNTGGRILKLNILKKREFYAYLWRWNI